MAKTLYPHPYRDSVDGYIGVDAGWLADVVVAAAKIFRFNGFVKRLGTNVVCPISLAAYSNLSAGVTRHTTSLFLK